MPNLLGTLTYCYYLRGFSLSRRSPSGNLNKSDSNTVYRPQMAWARSVFQFIWDFHSNFLCTVTCRKCTELEYCLCTTWSKYRARQERQMGKVPGRCCGSSNRGRWPSPYGGRSWAWFARTLISLVSQWLVLSLRSRIHQAWPSGLSAGTASKISLTISHIKLLLEKSS